VSERLYSLPETESLIVLQPWPRRRAVVLVYVYETEAAFHEALATHFGTRCARLLGICFGLAGEPIERGPVPVAAVVLQKPRLGSGYVSHEMVHAACRVMAHYGTDVITNNGRTLTQRQHQPEERLALLVESLNGQFWTEAYRRGLA
jgi:hypothetical protein